MNKKKAALLFLLFVFYTSVLYAQDKSINFYDPFNDNSNSWFVSNDETGSANVKEGEYVMACKNKDKSYMAIIPTSATGSNSTFTVSCTATWLSGITDYGYGIAWGDKPSKTYTCFFITANGHFKVTDRNNEERITIKEWTKSASIFMNGKNELSVEGKGRHLDFFINDLNVFSTETDVHNGRFYLTVNDPQVIAFDNVHFEASGISAASKASQASDYNSKTKKSPGEFRYRNMSITVDPLWLDSNVHAMVPGNNKISVRTKESPLFETTPALADNPIERIEVYLGSFDTLGMTMKERFQQTIKVLAHHISEYYEIIGTPINDSVMKSIYKSQLLAEDFTTSQGKTGWLVHGFDVEARPLGTYAYADSKLMGVLYIPDGGNVYRAEISMKNLVRGPLKKNIWEMNIAFDEEDDVAYTDFVKGILKTFRIE